MTNRNFNWRPSWLTATLGVAIGAVIAGAVVFAPMPAQAVHDGTGTFELDGDPVDESTLDDWDSAFQFGSPPYPSPRLLATVGPGETFVVDSGDPDDTAFVQSNKDVDEINTWNYGTKGINPPKDDITNAYAKASIVPGYAGGDQPGHPAGVHDHLVVYFGADRFADDGDSAMGFWFFRNDVGLGPDGFTGVHAVGDILIQVDYRGAGDNEIEVFKWVGSGGNAGGGKLQRLVIGTSSNPADTICNVTSNGFPADSACITTNVVQEDSPWAYVGKGEDFVGANRWPERVFMEGGFDVTALVGDVCFSDFMAETRTSHSETASLKDFALGNFDLCSIDVEKICVADSQIVNPADETFTTTHLVTITNDGFGGNLRDVELSDTTTSASKTCEIISVVPVVAGDATGLAGVGFVFNSETDSVEVADTLTGAIRVELECTTPDNPFQNRVEVKARAATGAPQDVTDFDLESTVEAGVCAATLNVGLAIKKWCQGDDGTAVDHPMGVNPYFYGIDPDDPLYDANDPGVDSDNPLELGVFLKAPNYVPEVCVDIEIANTSANQRMVFDGDDVDCSTADFATETGDYICDSDLGNLVPSTGLTLEPAGDAEGDDKFHIALCYTPTGPDGSNGTDPYDPSQALYSDTARAQAHGKLDDADAKTLPVTASCSLCPTCPCD